MTSTRQDIDVCARAAIRSDVWATGCLICSAASVRTLWLKRHTDLDLQQTVSVPHTYILFSFVQMEGFEGPQPRVVTCKSEKASGLSDVV